MNNRFIAFLILGLVSLSNKAIAQTGCELGSGLSMSGDVDSPWSIRVEFDPGEIPLNMPFDAKITICTKGAKLPDRITVDATMPAHKHGMNYNPVTMKLKERQYETPDLLFHMPGIWRLEITAYENTTPYRYTYDLTVQ